MNKVGAAVVTLSTLVVGWWVLFGELGESDDAAATPVPMPLSVSPKPMPAASSLDIEPLKPSSFASEDPQEERQDADRLLDVSHLLGMDHQGLPRAWVVRAGAFSDSEAAERLLLRLLADSYPAYRYQEPGLDGARHVVVIGPKVDRRRALDVKRQLGADHQIESVIQPYNPLK